jgi:hypothetical protein
MLPCLTAARRVSSALMRTSSLVLALTVAAVGLVGCTQNVDPAYLAAVKARTKAVCECRASDGLDCVRQMEERFPVVVPRGEDVERYESRLEEADRKELEDMRRQAGNCATVLHELNRKEKL